MLNHAEETDLKTRSTQNLWSELRAELSLTAAHIMRLGAIVVELESRGESIDSTMFPPAFLSVVRRIGLGELAPELFVRFVGLPSVLKKLGALPIDEQREILNDPERLANAAKPKLRRQNMHDMSNDNNAGRSFLGAAATATARDLADMLVEMIFKHETPDVVWASLLRHKSIQKIIAHAG